MLRVFKKHVRLPPLEGTWTVSESTYDGKTGNNNDEKHNSSITSSCFENKEKPGKTLFCKVTDEGKNVKKFKSRFEKNPKEKLEDFNAHEDRIRRATAENEHERIMELAGIQRKRDATERTDVSDFHEQAPIAKDPGPSPRDIFTARTVSLEVPPSQNVADVTYLRSRGWIVPPTEKILANKRHTRLIDDATARQPPKLKIPGKVKMPPRVKMRGERNSFTPKVKMPEEVRLPSMVKLPDAVGKKITPSENQGKHRQMESSVRSGADERKHTTHHKSINMFGATMRRDQHLQGIKDRAARDAKNYLSRMAQKDDNESVDTEVVYETLRNERQQGRMEAVERIEQLDIDIAEIKKNGCVDPRRKIQEKNNKWKTLTNKTLKDKSEIQTISTRKESKYSESSSGSICSAVVVQRMGVHKVGQVMKTRCSSTTSRGTVLIYDGKRAKIDVQLNGEPLKLPPVIQEEDIDDKVTASNDKLKATDDKVKEKHDKVKTEDDEDDDSDPDVVFEINSQGKMVYRGRSSSTAGSLESRDDVSDNNDDNNNFNRNTSNNTNRINSSNNSNSSNSSNSNSSKSINSTNSSNSSNSSNKQQQRQRPQLQVQQQLQQRRRERRQHDKEQQLLQHRRQRGLMQLHRQQRLLEC